MLTNFIEFKLSLPTKKTKQKKQEINEVINKLKVRIWKDFKGAYLKLQIKLCQVFEWNNSKLLKTSCCKGKFNERSHIWQDDINVKSFRVSYSELVT